MGYAPSNPVAASDLAELFSYDPVNGRLFWRARESKWFTDAAFSADGARNVWNARYAGREAISTVDRLGYRRGRLMGKMVSAHRIVWALNTGHWPVSEIDHVNGNPSDNRLCNLRAVTHEENSRNRKLFSHNKSGVNGVSWSKNAGKWTAAIYNDGARKHIGSFDCLEDAVAARKLAETNFGYHPNHGRLP